MVNYELNPTAENIKNTLLKNSSGRNEGIAHFVELLDAIDGNCVIALDDTWGNGKTFFIKQLQLVLQNYFLTTDETKQIQQVIQPFLKEHEVNKYLPVYYDAWSNDSDDDPVLSIIYNMLQDMKELWGCEATAHDWPTAVIRAFDVIVNAFSGIRIKDFLESVKGVNILSVIENHKKSDKLLNDLFDIILEKQPDDTRIVFFIDELDRCCPDFAVKILERIKHYFMHEKIIFVLSVNIMELQHTIRRHYGNEFDAVKYLTRFFDLTVSLPLPNMDSYYSTLNFLGNSYTRDSVAKAVINMYNFSLRDISRYLQMLRHLIPVRYNEYRSEFGFYMEILIPFMLGLRIHDTSKYDKFIRGEDASSFIDFVLAADTDWYCRILCNSDETFLQEKAEQQTLVSLEERFGSVYRCLFGTKNQNNGIPDEVTIGQTTFSSSGKRLIMGVMSFMFAKQNLQE